MNPELNFLLIIKLGGKSGQRLYIVWPYARTIIFSTMPLNFAQSEIKSCGGEYSFSPCLPVQVAQFAIRRLDLSRVDLWVVGQYIFPPLLIVQFLQVDHNILLVVWCS
jgi:hypothetical protein